MPSPSPVEFQGGKPPVCPHCRAAGQITEIERDVVLMSDVQLVSTTGEYVVVLDEERSGAHDDEPTYRCEACNQDSELADIVDATFP